MLIFPKTCECGGELIELNPYLDTYRCPACDSIIRDAGNGKMMNIGKSFVDTSKVFNMNALYKLEDNQKKLWEFASKLGKP
jgi:hypothetical protein